jgi:hypothetical protein
LKQEVNVNLCQGLYKFYVAVEGAYKTGKMWIVPLYNGVPIIARRKRGPKPEWKTKRVPARSIVHINRHVIKNNRDVMKKNPDLLKNSTDIAHLAPVLSVKHLQDNIYGHEVQINGPCRITYRPDAPKSCGATVWLETLSSVDVIRCKLA